MRYCFSAYGHENILGTHKTTIEFTKDKELSLKGNCIIGVKADFNLNQLKKFIKDINEKGSLGKKSKKIIIKIKSANLQEEVTAEVNPRFNDDKDMVIRKSNFICKRTFAIKANKGAFELSRSFINNLKKKNIKIIVEIN